MKLSESNIVLRLLGLLLLAAAVLKSYELLTVPVANTDIWSNRYLLIFTVEFELALGIWLLSGLFKRAAWLIALGCFSLFCCVTLYKALAGFGSCGCFGKVHVNPWMTLFVIDLPAVVLLAAFRPKGFDVRSITKPVELFKPLPSLPHFAAVFIAGLIALAVSAPALALNEPAAITTAYEVLEPGEWIGEELPILEHIDIGEQLREGNWLVVLYHYDCPSCAEAIPKIEQMAQQMAGNEDFLRFALIEMPPYGQAGAGPVGEDSGCVFGKLDASKEWFVTTPAMVLMDTAAVRYAWKGNAPLLDEIFSVFMRKKCLVFSKSLTIKTRKEGVL